MTADSRSGTGIPVAIAVCLISYAVRGKEGMILQIHDTGEAVYRWFSAILLFGDISGLLRFILLLAIVFIGGSVVFGELFYKKTLKMGPPAGAPGQEPESKPEA